MALRAAKIVAMEEEKVPRLPSVMSLWPSGRGVGDDALAPARRECRVPRPPPATSEAREPPTSTVPTAASPCRPMPMLRSVQVWPPKLNQKPQAMPRPWFLPSGAFMCGWFFAASSVGPMPIGP